MTAAEAYNLLRDAHIALFPEEYDRAEQERVLDLQDGDDHYTEDSPLQWDAGTIEFAAGVIAEAKRLLELPVSRETGQN